MGINSGESAQDYQPGARAAAQRRVMGAIQTDVLRNLQ
jgi:hypothetical protein